MSPCEPVTLSRKPTNNPTPSTTLEDYTVSSNGFLPEHLPLERLPDPYYTPWESLTESLPVALAKQTLRDSVHCLPVLSTDRLSTEPEWRRACVVLGFLTHAYIWGGDKAAEILPPQLTLPLLSVSSRLGLPPVATYASLNLWNFRTTLGGNLTDPAALHALLTFTGTVSESWFYTLSVALEARAAHLPGMILSGFTALCSPLATLTTLQETLTEIAHTLASLTALQDRMHDHCDPHVFYHRIRPFLAGSWNMGAAGLERGVFYDEGPAMGECQWRRLRGGSNGQSALIGLLDWVLGVEHAPGAAGEGDYHREVKEYMPEGHRRFLADLEEAYPCGLRKMVGELVMADGGSPAVAAVKEAFDAAVAALGAFRNRHLQMVTRYIIIPSRQPGGAGQGVNLATASSARATSGGGGREELTGTGGTALLPFLKQSRDETFRARRLQEVQAA
ncbi:hypothetical protein C8A05DRAFT_17065 [Staphylotrichum tortipilum]|uniref:Indoleamine 2,3-dioxygenase n=1 Tax=Staphylotrichum tortipilum TaxID=2831512 RepID=A0AAN6RSA5_9PEZI|nr:hypothetical protein C8A05DRAFT_17065 [Staphylotrichum longicolle]